MKKLLLIVGLGIWSIAGIRAQDTQTDTDDNSVKIETDASANADVDVNTDESSSQASVEEKDRSFLGKIGHGAKEAGKGVKRGASWTWDKTKHNKLTKNLFNQPKDDNAQISANNTPDENRRKRAGKVGHGAKEAGKGVKRGATWTWDKTKHNKLTKNLFNLPEQA
jgi:hypothetical protein